MAKSSTGKSPGSQSRSLVPFRPLPGAYRGIPSASASAPDPTPRRGKRRPPGFLTKVGSVLRKPGQKLAKARQKADKRYMASLEKQSAAEAKKNERLRREIAIKQKIYDDRIATNQARQEATRTRHEAGMYTASEHLDRASRAVGRAVVPSLSSAYRGLMKTTNKATRPKNLGPMRGKGGKFTHRVRW